MTTKLITKEEFESLVINGKWKHHITHGLYGTPEPDGALRGWVCQTSTYKDLAIKEYRYLEFYTDRPDSFSLLMDFEHTTWEFIGFGVIGYLNDDTHEELCMQYAYVPNEFEIPNIKSYEELCKYQNKKSILGPLNLLKSKILN